MVKTKGSIDKVNRRKRRSDFHKRRKIYAGKKVKKRKNIHGRLVPYVPKRKSSDPLKVYFWTIERMDPNKIHNFSRKSRAYMKKVVYGRLPGRIRYDASPEELSSKEAVAEMCERILWGSREGLTWLILLWTHRTNRFRCSPRAVATVRITDHEEGQKIRVYPSYKNRSLRRYSFWRGG